jgi:hypothetical protein
MFCDTPQLAAGSFIYFPARIIHERRSTRKSSGSAGAVEAFVNNAGKSEGRCHPARLDLHYS